MEAKKLQQNLDQVKTEESPAPGERRSSGGKGLERNKYGGNLKFLFHSITVEKFPLRLSLDLYQSVPSDFDYAVFSLRKKKHVIFNETDQQ